MNTTLKTLTKYETINDETNGVVGDGHFSENAHKVLSEQLISIINDYDFSEEKCIYYFYYPLSSEIFNKLIKIVPKGSIQLMVNSLQPSELESNAQITPSVMPINIFQCSASDFIYVCI